MTYKIGEKVVCSLPLGIHVYLKGFEGEISEIDEYDNKVIYLIYADNEGPWMDSKHTFRGWKKGNKSWFVAEELSYPQKESFGLITEV
jgi:hypothetical protein